MLALPSLFDLRHAYPLLPQLRGLRVHETYGNRPWHVDRTASSLVRGRKVLITGASTTLGTELARRVAHGAPRHLVIVDEPAAGAMRVFHDIRDRSDFIACSVRVADCAEAIALGEIFEEFSPELVFHCGALMHEFGGAIQPVHIARANVLTAFRIAVAAREHGASDFVLASSEQATQRSSAFGMSQALAEAGVLSLKRRGSGGFRVSALRLPRIWADAGSVVERFEDQLRSGGPLYVNPAAHRRCVQPWEAAQALLRVVRHGHGGGIFALTIGDDVDIAELAQRIVWMNGLTDEVEVVYEPGRTDGDTPLAGDEEQCGSALHTDIVEVLRRGELEARLRARFRRLVKAIDGVTPDRDAIHRALQVR